jgi:hypothetical protein
MKAGDDRKRLDRVHGRDRRALRYRERHADQNREQGPRLSGVVAGSERAPASSAVDGRRAQPLPQSCAEVVSRGDLTARHRCYAAQRRDPGQGGQASLSAPIAPRRQLGNEKGQSPVPRRRLSSEPPRRLGLQRTARADVPAHFLTAARGMTGRLALRKLTRWASACSAPFASRSAFFGSPSS